MKLEAKIAERFPLLGSSQNSEEISLTIKGILMGAIPLILFILNQFGITASQELLQDTINVIFGLVAGVMVLIGLIRKFTKR